MKVKIKRNLPVVIILFSMLISGCTNHSLKENGSQGYVQIQNAKIFYQTQGQGYPVLVVHGGPGLDQTYLQPQLFELADKHQLIFYDQRASGKSLQSVDHYNNININQFVSDLEGVRAKLGLKKFILMGHSWGGLLSMYYAIKQPEHLSGLILLNTAPADYKGQKAFVDNFVERTSNIKKDIAPLFSYEEFKKQNASEISELYRKVFSAYFHNPSDVKKLNLAFNVESARSGFRVNEEMSKTAWLSPGIDLFPNLKKLNIPTLIIHGKQDIVPVWTAKEINLAIKDSKLVILEDCGHFPYIERPNEFKKAVNLFINTVQKKG